MRDPLIAFSVDSHSRPITTQQCQAILTDVVRRQVFPTLLRSRLESDRDFSVTIEQLVTDCIGGNISAATSLVLSLAQRDSSPDQLCLGLLTPAARCLGQHWADDRCSFVDVTVGVSSLETALRALQTACCTVRADFAKGQPCILLIALPGGQHSFGLSMLAGFFVRAGWSTQLIRAQCGQSLSQLITLKRPNVVGFSLSHSDLLDTARDAIAVVRAASRKRGPAIIVGGPLLVDDPSLAQQLGADGTAIDGPEAVALATTLL